ncbi:MAG TPA: hypothetical protein VFI96_05125 [Longimicrobiaceae bacterium]|nr:hypothetical protein [Longimicrobiaceae bacterium]
MPVLAPSFQTLEAALEDLGVCWALVGDPFTASGMSVLGLTPGDITPAMNPSFVSRIYEEYSSQPVDVKLKGYAPTVDIPLIWGDPDVYAKITPTASAAGGHTTPQPLTYTTLLLIPESEFVGGLEFSAGAWVKPAGGLKHAVWFPKGYFSGAFPTFGSLNTENKNRTGTITFTGVLADAANWVEGTKSWIIGDPDAAGVTGLAL